jgi:hypothetical protein
MCNGTCEATATGSCSGECYGMCSAQWTAECNGDADVTANAECKASCDARANAKAMCDLPTVTIVGVVVADQAKQAKIDKLVATLKANYPKLLQAQQKIQFAIAPSAAAFVTASRAAGTTLASAGVQATACLAVALDAVVDAAASVDASVSVSVMVSASVSASGTAQ